MSIFHVEQMDGKAHAVTADNFSYVSGVAIFHVPTDIPSDTFRAIAVFTNVLAVWESGTVVGDIK